MRRTASVIIGAVLAGFAAEAAERDDSTADDAAPVWQSSRIEDLAIIRESGPDVVIDIATPGGSAGPAIRALSALIHDPAGAERLGRAVETAALGSHLGTYFADGTCVAVTYQPSNLFRLLPPGDPAAKGGLWHTAARITGCGPERLQNVAITLGAGGEIAAHRLLPGATLSLPGTQRTAETLALAAAHASAGCPAGEPGRITDTSLAETDPGFDPVAALAWSERWTVSLCERLETVTLRFMRPAPGAAETVAVQSNPGPSGWTAH